MAAELIAGNHSRRVGISGLPPEAFLQRVIDRRNRRITLPPQGIVLSQVLGEALGVRPGDTLTVKILQGERPVRQVPVAAWAEDFAGVAAYMDLDGLNALLQEGDRVTGAHLTVRGSEWATFLEALKRTPRVGGVAVKDTMRESFRSTTAESIGLVQMIYLTFATVVAFGIVYNSARISLSERARELATLRVLGFSQGEVGAVLVGELVMLTVVALPLGLLFGSGMAKAILTSINTETVRLPLVLTWSNYAFAVMVVTAATAGSAVLACRKLNRLDLVGVLKARD